MLPVDNAGDQFPQNSRQKYKMDQFFNIKRAREGFLKYLEAQPPFGLKKLQTNRILLISLTTINDFDKIWVISSP